MMTHELLARLHVIRYHDHVVSTLGKTVIVPLIYPNIDTFIQLRMLGKMLYPPQVSSLEILGGKRVFKIRSLLLWDLKLQYCNL